MALVWAFSGDLTGSSVPLTSAGWTFRQGGNGTACDVTASARQPLVGYGGAAYAFRIWGGSYSWSTSDVTTPPAAWTGLTDGILGCHVYRGPDVGTGYIKIQSGGTDVVQVRNSTSAVDVYVHDGSSLVLQFTCTDTWTASTTVYIGIRYKPGASGEIQVCINGGTVDSDSGSYHTGAWDGVQWHTPVNQQRYVWMPTVWSSAADPAVSISQWAAKITPDTDAAVGSFTASTGSDLYAMVDEAVYSASDYAETTTTPDDTMRFTGTAEDSVHADWAPAAIAGIVGYAAVRGDGALNAAQIAWSSGGTAALGSTVTTSSSVVTVTDVLTVDPNTSAAFANVDAIDALQFGVKAS